METIRDVTYVDNENIAVISSTQKNIELISLKLRNTFKTVNTSFPSCGITYNEGNFIVSPNEGQLQEIRLKDTKTSGVGTNMISIGVASLNDTIYSVKRGENTIVSHNKHGNILWTFTNEMILRGISGITVDAYGNVFVAGGQSKNVIAIAHDGKMHKILLSEADLYGLPWAIHYNSELKSLLIANGNSGQLLFLCFIKFKLMASSFDHCGICSSRHVSKPSVVWCPHCDEGLCQDCIEHHSLSKATRNHKTVPFDEYHKLPLFIANINLHCDEHNEKYQLFCKEHNELLCRKCAISAKHVECKKLFPVEDVIKNAKTSVTFTEIESSFQKMKENLKLILEDRQKNISSLFGSKQKIESEISAIRRQINQHLDEIQHHFIVELNKAVENSTHQIQAFIASLKNKQRETDECIEDVESIKDHATDMQTYIGTRLLENKLNQIENDMQSWINGGSLAHTVVSYEIDTVLNNIKNEITKFGKPVVDVQSCKLPIRRRKESQAQLMKVKAEPKTIDHITLTLKTKIKTSASNVSGCCILPCGLTYTNGSLIVSPNNGQLQEISLGDNKTNTICSSISSNYVASLGNKLFFGKSEETDTIICQNRNGEMLWTFTNKTALRKHRCIAVDEFGNVFVAGNKSNSVVAISSDGKEHKILLSKTDLVVKPWAIDYNIKLKSLLVANERNGQVLVYNVNYA
ncbi:unnamed protein product [Mytilus edulis]|uniref:B box-type domain-containing protein n=1 Tax=Mytilus edulis TaxID=6550 RepID=A0A8S3V5H7_MYTED|nr:unnamed protein product [Mytilus edulis]